MLSKEKIKIVQKFQMYSAEFIAQMLEIYPENIQLQKYNRKFHILCKADPVQPILYFSQYVAPQREQILNSDIDYFLNIEENETILNNEDSLIDALQLREMWRVMDEDEKENNKKCIFQYLVLLLHFCDDFKK